MKTRPILFSGPMVRAILAGWKTQTRRVLKRLPCQCDAFEPAEMPVVSPEGWQMVGHSGRWWCLCCVSQQDAMPCPYGKPGDRLWVRETFVLEDGGNYYTPVPMTDRPCKGEEGGNYVCVPHYRATEEEPNIVNDDEDGDVTRWKPSIFMPRWASRITLEIVSVRIERLQDITEADAIAEGCGPLGDDVTQAYRLGYMQLWGEINGPDSWTANPWVWVVEFKRITGAT